jgi:hypothetical protein
MSRYDLPPRAISYTGKKAGRPTDPWLRQLEQEQERDRVSIRDQYVAEIIARTRAGDFDILVNYLEQRGEMTALLYDLLLAIIRGDVKRRRGQKPDPDVRWRDFHIYFDVILLGGDGVPTEAAVAETAAKYGVSQRTVYNALKAHR